MEQTQSTPPPKKGVIINLMFPIDSNDEALHIKDKVDELIKHLKEKRYTFQIVES